MVYFLIVVLIVELEIIYFFNGKKIFSCSFVSCLMFLFSTIIYAAYKNSYYGKDLQSNIIFVVPYLIIFILIGELLARKFNFNIPQYERKSEIRNSQKIDGIYFFKPYLIFVLSVFTLISGILYFWDVYKFSLLVGNVSGNFFTMAEYVRHASNYGTGKLLYSPSTLVSQLNICSECIVYMCIYIFVNNWFGFGEKKKSILFPCIGYIFYILACDSRSNLIKNITVIAIIIFGCLEEKNYNARKINRKIMKIGIIAVILFFIMFRVLGYRTGTSSNYNWDTNIAKYVSSGIYGLDEYLIKGDTPNHLFGESTFRLIYLKLNDFGASFKVMEANDTFFSYAKGESNIYTGLKGIINDFSVIGAGFFLLFWSFFCTKVVKRIKNNNYSLYNCILAGLLFYPIVMISISVEWRNVLSIPTLYTLLYTYILNYFIVRKMRGNK